MSRSVDIFWNLQFSKCVPTLRALLVVAVAVAVVVVVVVACGRSRRGGGRRGQGCDEGR